MSRTIFECLMKMRTQELDKLLLRFELPLSQGHRKSQREALCRKVSALLPTKGNRLRFILGGNAIMQLKECFAAASFADGHLFLPKAALSSTDTIFSLQRLIDCGLAWMEKKDYYVQSCVPAMLRCPKQELAFLLHTDNTYAAALGVAALYGIASVEDMASVVLPDTPGAEEQILELLVCRGDPDQVTQFPDTTLSFIHPSVADVDRVMDLLSSPHVRALSPTPLTQERAEALGHKPFFGEEKWINEIKPIYLNAGFSEEAFFSLIGKAQFVYQVGPVQDIPDMMLSPLEDKINKDIGQHLINTFSRYLDTVPLWRNRGRNTLEMAKEKAFTKPRWSALCPCGSGRIYGHCCGKGN